MQVTAPTPNQFLIASFITVFVAAVAFPGSWVEFFGQRLGQVPTAQIIGNATLTTLATLGTSILLANITR